MANDPFSDSSLTVGGVQERERRINIPCQLCGADDARLLFTKNFYNIVKCRRCGLTYLNPQPSPAELAALYSAGYYFTREGKAPHGYRKDYFARPGRRLARARKRVRRILRFKKGGELLDVGCGPGVFLEAARECFGVAGVEIIREAAESARSILGDPCNIICGDFFEAELPKEEFDVITMYDFLEHVRLPFDNLVKAHRCLKEGGLLVLGLPNIASLGAFLKHQNWRGYSLPPEHLFFFCPRTIAALLRKAGFRCLRSPAIQCHPLRDTMYIYALKT